MRNTSGRPAADYEILDASGNHVAWGNEISECHESIAEFLGVPVAELARFKTKSRAKARGRQSFEAYERHGRVYEIVKPLQTVERRCGRRRKHQGENS